MEKENKRIKLLDLYGEVDYLTDGKKISFVADKFEKATIKNSLIKNELRLLDDQYGMYQNIKDTWQLCELGEKSIEKDYYGDQYTVYETKHLEELTLDKFLEVVNDPALIEEIEKEADTYLSKNRLYFEVEVNQKKSYKNTTYSRFYIETPRGDCCEISIDNSGYIELLNRDLELSNDCGRLQYAVDEKIDTELEKFLTKKVTKLSNGYVYKDTFYESLDDVREAFKQEDEVEEGDEVHERC